MANVPACGLGLAHPLVPRACGSPTDSDVAGVVRVRVGPSLVPEVKRCKQMYHLWYGLTGRLRRACIGAPDPASSSRS